MAIKEKHTEPESVKSQESMDYEVENALLANALAGDVTAQIFWLTNRKPNKWRNIQNNIIITKE